MPDKIPTMSYAGAEATAFQEAQQISVHTAIQVAAYKNDVLFAFSDSLPLTVTRDNLIEQRTAVGAAGALVGYAKHASKRIGVLASSDAFAQMAPTLRQAQLDNVTFYVGAASYDFSSGSLVANVDEAYGIAKALGYKVYSVANDASDALSVAAAAAAASGVKVVLYDGVRGVLSSAFKAPKEHAVKPYRYNGLKEPESVVVALASSSAQVESLLSIVEPSQAVVEHIPATASTIFVDGENLLKDVSSAIRLHFGLRNGPIVKAYAAEAAPVALGLLDGDRGLATRVAAPIARAGDYIGKHLEIGQVFDNNVDGGVVQFSFGGFSGPFKALIVNRLSILRAAQLDLAPGSTLVLAASPTEIEALPENQKHAISGFKILSLDYSRLDSQATEGRTNLFALQAVAWQLLEPSASVDDITSRIVHSNTQDLELLGSTISKLIENLRAHALVEVDASKWSELQADTSLLKPVVPTSFYAAAQPEAPLAATAVTRAEVAKRIAFSESYGGSQQLRPDVAAKTFTSKVLINQRVTPADYDRHIFHLELDITGTGLTYAIGEALGVHAPNRDDDVAGFIEWYGLDPEEAVSVPQDGVLLTKTAYQAIRDNLDLFGKVPKKFYEGLCRFASGDEKPRLQKLCGPAGAVELKRREEEHVTYADILAEFPSARPTIADLVELVAPLKRREYSIASSQKIHPNAVHLLIVVVDWQTPKGVRYGQCSKFLADLKPGAEVTVSVKTSVMKLPKDPKTPVIMAGLGTGLAPFKAFLEEKLWQRDQGHEIGDVYLFLGARHQRQEYLYGELFEAYKKAGILTHIGAAFSRDQKEKIYIQHRIKQAKTELIDAFVKKGGNFYLCGPTWPVPDVSEALYDLVATDAATRGETVEEDALIEQLKDHERYILEVY